MAAAPIGRLEGQVAVVTGAGQGIGRAIARALAREGASVVLAARSADKLEAVAGEIREDGGRALPVPTDLRDPESVQRLSATVADRFGAVDVLVNNSGVAGPTALLWEQPLEEWEETFRVNVTGVYLCCRAFLPAMIERRSGSLIVIGSMTGKRPLYARTPYAASKMPLVGLVLALAWETGPAGIRVNLISPGPVTGERIEGVLAGQAEAQGISVDEARAKMTAISPLQRFVDPEDVARAAVFLCCDEAVGVTGEDLNVSAGAVTFG
jgi:NAD(P)-dependent dehydrogenase (short-subunit alcohol dehydrogenase family)